MYDELKKQLLADKDDVLKRIEQESDFGKDHAADSGELSRVDNHPADEATDLYDRERSMAIRQQWEQHLHEIDAALDRLEKGTYGICEKTGETIPYERLKANPAARSIVQESSRKHTAVRPPEEDVLRSDEERDYSYYMDEDTSPEDDQTGYTEELESFLSTGLSGFEGSENVTVHHNKQYKDYTGKLDDENES